MAAREFHSRASLSLKVRKDWCSYRKMNALGRVIPIWASPSLEAAKKPALPSAPAASSRLLYLGCISAVSRLYLGYISAVSRLYLAHGFGKRMTASIMTQIEPNISATQMVVW